MSLDEINAEISSTRAERPLGTSHPQHPEIIYPINYGYVDGMLADDGDAQDVYLFGTDKPLTHFEGKVIAVYHRHDMQNTFQYVRLKYGNWGDWE